MGREHPVYGCCRTVRPWGLHFHPRCNEPPRSISPPHFADGRVPELKEKLSLAEAPMIPLDSYHLCLTGTGRFWVIAQISLAFAFGKHFILFLNPL